MGNENYTTIIDGMLTEAARLLDRYPDEAEQFGVDEQAIEGARIWFTDQNRVEHRDDANRIASFTDTYGEDPLHQRYHRTFDRIVRHGFVAPGATRWQESAREAARQGSWNETDQLAQRTAVEHATFLQRALIELRYHGVQSTENPLAVQGTLLLHRLWSAERGSDHTLANDLYTWLKQFASWTTTQEATADIQHSLVSDLHALPSPFRLNQLDFFPTYGPAAIEFEEPLIIDSAHLYFGSDFRFRSYAAPWPGAVLLVDTQNGAASGPWRAHLHDIFPPEVCRDAFPKLPIWVEPEQDLKKTANDLTAIGLVESISEVPVRYRGVEQHALLETFHDYHHWFNATDGLPIAGMQSRVRGNDIETLVERVTDAYLKMAAHGYIAVSPQFFLHRQTHEVRVAQLRFIFRMKAFPYTFFIDQLASSIMTRLGLPERKRDQVAYAVIKRVDAFLREGRLPERFSVVDLPLYKRLRLWGRRNGGGNEGGGNSAPPEGGSTPGSGEAKGPSSATSASRFAGFSDPLSTPSPSLEQSWQLLLNPPSEEGTALDGPPRSFPPSPPPAIFAKPAAAGATALP